MSIAFSVSVVIVVFLWYVFGYAWDWPLRILRSQPLRKIHLGFIIPLAFLLLYVYWPLQASVLMFISTTMIRIVSVVLACTLNFIYFYLLAIQIANDHPVQNKAHSAYWASILIRFCLLLSIIGLLEALLRHFSGFDWPITITVGILAGYGTQLFIKNETSRFLEQTKHTWTTSDDDNPT